MLKEEERKLARKIVRGVAKEFKVDGFRLAKPTFLVRPFEHFAQFVHFHKFSFGPRFRVHFGIRVLNDPFVAIALNGPSYEHAGKYGDDELETFECADTLKRLIRHAGLTWFAALSNTKALAQSESSPLKERDRGALLEDLAGRGVVGHRERSLQLLGIHDQHV